VETGANEADQQVSSKSKLRFWLPTKKKKEKKKKIPDEEINDKKLTDKEEGKPN
jgi:hypothetical protein